MAEEMAQSGKALAVPVRGAELDANAMGTKSPCTMLHLCDHNAREAEPGGSLWFTELWW